MYKETFPVAWKQSNENIGTCWPAEISHIIYFFCKNRLHWFSLNLCQLSIKKLGINCMLEARLRFVSIRTPGCVLLKDCIHISVIQHQIDGKLVTN